MKERSLCKEEKGLQKSLKLALIPQVRKEVTKPIEEKEKSTQVYTSQRGMPWQQKAERTGHF